MAQKPLLVERQEFIEALRKLITDYGLPAFVLEPVIAGVLDEVHSMVQIQYENELKNYKEMIEKEKEEGENDESKDIPKQSA